MIKLDSIDLKLFPFYFTNYFRAGLYSKHKFVNIYE